MARQLRIVFDGAWYHVMNRGINHQNLFFNDEQRFAFFDILDKTRQVYGIEIHAYCLMDNHYHLIVHTPRGNISHAMKYLNSSEELNLSGLDDFIEKPSQDCKDDECKQGIAKVIFVLSKNPGAIMDIIANHPHMPATFLLDDLADKMRKENCLETLGLLFENCLDKLVESCIYNLHDLERCIKAMPTYSSKVMEHIVSNDSQMKRILEGDKNPEATIKEIEAKYPNYKAKFSECYTKHFAVAPSPK